MFLIHPEASENFKVFEHGLEYVGALINYLQSENNQNILLALRCLTNLFNISSGQFVLLKKYQLLME